MSIKIITKNAIRVSRKSGNYPEEINNGGQTYVFGTIDESGAVYYLESWIHGGAK
jgi:hypothetical protein